MTPSTSRSAGSSARPASHRSAASCRWGQASAVSTSRNSSGPRGAIAATDRARASSTCVRLSNPSRSTGQTSSGSARMRLASPAVSGTASATSSAAAASSRAKIRGSLSRASCGATTVTYHSAKGFSVAGADSTATASAPGLPQPRLLEQQKMRLPRAVAAAHRDGEAAWHPVRRARQVARDGRIHRGHGLGPHGLLQDVARDVAQRRDRVDGEGLAAGVPGGSRLSGVISAACSR